MRCPHCRTDFHDEPNFDYIGKDADGHWGIVTSTCSACLRYTMKLQRGVDLNAVPGKVFGLVGVIAESQIHPKGSLRAPVPKEVPSDIAEDFVEAALVLADSPKASAALSRRCLQHLLRTAAEAKASDLAKEIQEVLDSGKLPSHLAESIDAIRNVGNFSAHPLKTKQTGEILPVEPHEAEWNLEVLEDLFDFYFVRPALIGAKRAALNAKLASAGKPPLK